MRTHSVSVRLTRKNNAPRPHLTLHTAKILRLSEDLPMVIEIVDSREKIDTLMPHIDEMVREGLVMLEPVQVIKYRADVVE